MLLSRAPPLSTDAMARARRFWRWVWGILAGLIAAWIAVTGLSGYYGIWLNETKSLPGHAYLIEKGAGVRGTLRRGELLAFRGGPNKRYPTGYPWVKIVGGVGGDRVTAAGGWYYVNGQRIGHAKARTRFGEPLAPGPTGVIPPGHYFIYTPHPDSYDSRYADIGWIRPEQEVGRALPLF